jgi:alpha-tubulin suppressor-like RCC1 family protein
MRTIKLLTRGRMMSAIVLSAFGLLSTTASAATVSAVWNSAADVPVTANGYSATGSMINFTLNFAPATGTDLMAVSNTALDFIVGTFDNLAHGQVVKLSYGEVTYRFVANYYGGSGNDLVLVWASNRAFGWGWDQYGQVGDNASGVNRLLPVPVTATGVLAGKTIVALAAGWSHSLGVCSDGTVAAWGWNREGELGDNSTTERHAPVSVNTAPGSALYGRRVVALAGGAYHSLALCSDGTVAAWGKNTDGQLGDNAMSGMQSQRPVAVNTNAGVSALYGKTVVAIAAGFAHNLALCSDGTVVAWGRNDNGQLGNNTNTFTGSYVPVAVSTNSGVSALYGKMVTAIAAGSGHSVALCSDGAVVTWGRNDHGQLGNNTTAPTNAAVAVNTNQGVSALCGRTAVAIAAGYAHTLALCSDGAIAAWGWNQYGQLGNGTTTELYPFGEIVPVAVNTNAGVSALSGETVVAIAAGYTHSLAMCADGTLAAWGQNNYGQNGDNTTTLHNVPLAVNTTPLAAGQRFGRVAAGSFAYHTLAWVAAPPASLITLTGAQKLPAGSFQFAFSNTPGAFFSGLAATNPGLPLSNWTSLTGLVEVSPGQFQFTDSQATSTPRRFYRVRSP